MSLDNVLGVISALTLVGFGIIIGLLWARRLNTPKLTPAEPYTLAVDQELITAHLGCVDTEDSREMAQRKLRDLIQWHIDVATDPRVNGGFKLMPETIHTALKLWRAQEERKRWYRAEGNCPGHCHRVPGIWDDDNGELAGKPCGECALWNAAKELT